MNSSEDTTDFQPQARSRGLLYRFSFTIDTFMRNVFFRLGLFVGNNPLKVILASLIVTGLCGVGFIRFRQESRDEELWVPQGTVAVINQKYVTDTYGRNDRLMAIVFKTNNPSEGLATKQAFLDMLEVAEKGYYRNVTDPSDEGKTITYSDRCVPTFDRDGNELCLTISPFGLFYKTENIVKETNGRVNFFRTVRTEIENLSDDDISNTLRNPPDVTYNGVPFNAEELYAPTGDSDQPIQVINYYQFSQNFGVVKDGATVDPEADALEEEWTLFLKDPDNNLPRNDIEWFVNSAWGQEQSLENALSGDLPLLSFGFVLLGIYVVLFLGDFHFVRSHRLLGLIAIATCGIAIGSGFGLSSALGMFYGPVHSILPLLVVGIGVDDCFHVTKAADEVFLRETHKNKPVAVRIALALSQAGTAITVTSFTNIVVFLLSAISRLPALRFFAVWAAFCIFFAWIYAITFYTAFVTLDMRRIEAARLDCVPCFKRKGGVTNTNWFGQPPNGFSRFFERRFGPIIMNPIVKIVLIILFVAGLGVCAYGCSQLYLKFRFAFFYPAGSYQREYQDVIDENFKLGDGASIYIRAQDMSSQENQKRLLNLCGPNGTISRNEWVQPDSVDCWYAVMRTTEGFELGGGEYYNPSEFVEKVQSFISEGIGGRYNSSIIFNEDRTEVTDTRFGFQYIYRESNVDQIEGLNSVRETASAEGFGEVQGIPAAFPYSYVDIFVEQYDALEEEIALSLGLACVAVILVCFVLIGHPTVAIISLIVIGMVIIDVLGLTYFTGINLNSVSVITLVLVTGISVDFVVHIARSFLEQVGTKQERAIKALGTMGPPVFYAGFSTFLAIIVLAFAKSYIFQVIFQGFLFLIVFAFLHGLILGPILLSLVGPKSFYESEKEKHYAEQQLEDRFSGKVNQIEHGDEGIEPQV